MVYMVNRGMRTSALSNLNAREHEFYQEAVKRFHNNVPWSEFEEFAFGMGSPLYANRISHLEVLDEPLYEALTNMWLDLGVKQGLIAEDRAKRGETRVQRRAQGRSRETSNRRNGKKNNKLAAANSFVASHS